MANARLYRFAGSLTEAGKTGKPQNEVKTGEDFFGTLYWMQRLEGFLKAMTGLSSRAARAIARNISLRSTTPWTSDARRAVWRSRSRCWQQHLTGWRHGLPPVVQPVLRLMKVEGVDKRLRFHAGDFFKRSASEIPTSSSWGHLHDTVTLPETMPSCARRMTPCCQAAR